MHLILFKHSSILWCILKAELSHAVDTCSVFHQIIGPYADNYNHLFGDYHANQDRSFTKTPLQGLREIYSNAKYGVACTDTDQTPCLNYQQNVTSNTVTGSDLVFVVLGTGTVTVISTFNIFKSFVKQNFLVKPAFIL